MPCHSSVGQLAVRKRRAHGAIENRAQARLYRYTVVRPYWKDNIEQMATELLKCSFSRALEALTASIGDAEPDSIDPYRSAAGYVARILNGEKQANLQVQAPQK